jgi:phage terminase small subunit
MTMAKFELVDVESNAIKRPLTPKQDMFVREYLIDLNATQAAIRAGYSAKTADVQASRLLGNVQVAAAVQAAMDKRAEETGLDAKFVLNGIVKLIERCEQAVPVLDHEGNETGEWRFESSSAMRGYELLGKHLKLFTDKIEQSGNINLTVSTGIERG